MGLLTTNMALNFKYLILLIILRNKNSTSVGHYFYFPAKYMRNILLIACLFLCASSLAQIEIDLNPVTITAVRTSQKANETGRNISVLDGRLFNQLPVHSLDELLKYVPGVEIQSRGPMGAQSDIVIRGGTFQQVLVLLDGLKVNDPITGHFSSYIPIAPYEIERIEILRGPAAAVYGAEAVGGVINVITKTFDQFKKEKSHHETIGLALGEYGLVNGNVGWHATGPKVNASLGMLSNNTFGQLQRGTRGYLHKHTFSGSVNFSLKNNWQLALRSSYDTRSFAAQNFYTTFISDTATEKVTGWWNQARLKQQSANHSQEISVLYKQTKDHYLYNPLSIANDNRANFMLVQYVFQQKLNNLVNLSVGGQLDRRAISSNDRGDHSAAHGALFAALMYANKNLKIAPALRVDKDENYGTAVLPQLNASYQVKNITLRTNAGRSIRGADFTERYNNYNKTFVSGGSIGNPDLSTENAWSYEVGADVILGNNFKASVTGFYRHQNNVIDYVITPYSEMPRKINLSPTGTYALAKNISKVNTSGLEFELSYQKAFGLRQHLYANAGVSLLHSSDSSATPSFYIISHAKTLVQSNVIYRYKKISLAVNMLYKERNAQTATAISAGITTNYFLLNGKISYVVYKEMQFFISVDNITDIKYSDLLGSIMPRRWTSLGITIDL